MSLAHGSPRSLIGLDNQQRKQKEIDHARSLSGRQGLNPHVFQQHLPRLCSPHAVHYRLHALVWDIEFLRAEYESGKRSPEMYPLLGTDMLETNVAMGSMSGGAANKLVDGRLPSMARSQQMVTARLSANGTQAGLVSTVLSLPPTNASHHISRARIEQLTTARVPRNYPERTAPLPHRRRLSPGFRNPGPAPRRPEALKKQGAGDCQTVGQRRGSQNLGPPPGLAWRTRAHKRPAMRARARARNETKRPTTRWRRKRNRSRVNYLT